MIKAWLSSRAGVAVLAVVGTAMVTGGLSVAAAESGGDTIHGCYGSPRAHLRIIDPGQGESCKDGETAISWNSEGRVGATGPSGALALAGRACAAGASVTGFDSSGNPTCSDGSLASPAPTEEPSSEELTDPTSEPTDATSEPTAPGDETTTVEDADGDGLPDTEDCAPAAPNPPDAEGCFAPASVYDVSAKVVTGDALVSSLVVTAVTTSGAAAWIAAQPSQEGFEGVEGSAIKLVLNEVESRPELAIGDVVTAYGATRENAGHVELVAQGVEVTGRGAALGEPTALSAEELVGRTELDGTLVEVTDPELRPLGQGGWVLVGGVTVDGILMGGLPTLPAGTQLSSIVGIAQTAQSEGTALLLPRGPEDIVTSE